MTVVMNEGRGILGFAKRKGHFLNLVHFFFVVFQKARDCTNGLRIKHCQKLRVLSM